MFDKAVLDTIEQGEGNRTWTTMISFGLQMVAVGVLVIMPLIYTEAIPNLRIAEAPPVPPAPRMHDAVEVIAVHREARRTTEFINGALLTPQSIPKGVKPVNDPQEPTETSNDVGPTVPWSTNSTPTNQQIASLKHLLPVTAMPKVEPPKVTRQARISVLLEGNLIKRVEPVYPTPARIAHVEGTVVLKAIIDTDGRVVNLRVVSGPPLLMTAAVDAVKQWRYRPYILNNAPIEVETQVVVNFILR